MDLLSTSLIFNKSNKEFFQDEKEDAKTNKFESIFIIMIVVISLSISVYAVYVSWKCNTAMKMGLPFKILYAIFAYVFGFIYLIFYFLFKKDMCPVAY